MLWRSPVARTGCALASRRVGRLKLVHLADTSMIKQRSRLTHGLKSRYSNSGDQRHRRGQECYAGASVIFSGHDAASPHRAYATRGESPPSVEGLAKTTNKNKSADASQKLESRTHNRSFCGHPGNILILAPTTLKLPTLLRREGPNDGRAFHRKYHYTGDTAVSPSNNNIPVRRFTAEFLSPTRKHGDLLVILDGRRLQFSRLKIMKMVKPYIRGDPPP